MLTSMREIQELALYRKQPDEPLSLRFLSLATEQPQDDEQGAGTVYLQLSPLIPIPGPYLTVSYTWQRSGLIPDDVPQYIVLKPAAIPVQVAPELNHVIYRTLRFAARQCIQYFWLDQLCVDQTDPLDIEKHLQCMDRVYAESQCTLAPLCMLIWNQSILESLASHPQDLRMAELSMIERTLASLEQLVEDTWFWRTWTYHERLCASSVYLAISLHGARFTSTETQDCFIVADDFIVSIERVQCMIEGLRKNDIIKAGMPPSPPREQSRRLWALFQEFFVKQTIIAGRTNPIIWSKYIMKAIEKRDNLVVSDRLAIHSNIRHHTWRLRTTLLQNARYSYSTCSLVLVLSNYLLLNEKSSRQHFRLPIDQTIIGVIRKMHGSEQLRLVHHPPSSQGENIVVFPLWTQEFLENITRKSSIGLRVASNGEGTQDVREQSEQIKEGFFAKVDDSGH
jgi:hypothetical protein